ncbi:tRNA synthetases class I (M)-domain-containing protein [Tuber brumale]|nr:tRNA synthetases class I (M)-domain-containing protein [Tuber brumale]
MPHPHIEHEHHGPSLRLKTLATSLRPEGAVNCGYKREQNEDPASLRRNDNILPRQFYECVNFCLASVVDPESGRKQQISIDTLKVVEWTEGANYPFRLPALAPRLLDLSGEPRLDSAPRTLRRTYHGNGKLPRKSIHPVPELPPPLGHPNGHRPPRRWSASGSARWRITSRTPRKDTLRFCTIYWPAFPALNLPLPCHILTHAHWTMNRRKTSKRDGNAANPFFALSEFGVDVMRFYLLHEGGITDDDNYGELTVIASYKKDSIDGLGSLPCRIHGQKFDVERAVKRSVELIDPKCPVRLSSSADGTDGRALQVSQDVECARSQQVTVGDSQVLQDSRLYEGRAPCPSVLPDPARELGDLGKRLGVLEYEIGELQERIEGTHHETQQGFADVKGMLIALAGGGEVPDS